MKRYIDFIKEMVENKPNIDISELKEYSFVIDIRKTQHKSQFTVISDNEKLKILNEFEKYFDTSNILLRLNKDIKNTWGWKFKIEKIGFNKIYLDYRYYNQNIPECSNYSIPIISWKDFLKNGLKNIIEEPFIFDKNYTFIIDIENTTEEKQEKQLKAIEKLKKIGADYNEDRLFGHSRAKIYRAWEINIRKWYKYSPIYIDYITIWDVNMKNIKINNIDFVTLDEFLEVGLYGVKELIEMKKDAKNFNL